MRIETQHAITVACYYLLQYKNSNPDVGCSFSNDRIIIQVLEDCGCKITDDLIKKIDQRLKIFISSKGGYV